MKTLGIVFVAATAVMITSCALARSSRSISDIGPVAIGGTPSEPSRLESSDCVQTGSAAFQDCTAVSDEGLRYVFFGGVLAKITAMKGEIADSVQFPAAVRLDDRLDDALREIERNFGVKLSCEDQAKKKICASDFVFRSSAGVLYSLELSGDENGRLAQVVARTDY